MKSDLQIKSDGAGELPWDAAAPSRQLRPAARATPQQIRDGITAALMRHARREAGRIAIDVEGDVVTLHGQVDSLAERDAAMGTAFAARGVAQVIDQLEVTGQVA